ncbi:uracil-DNA glycosylase [Jeotgalibacillus sp. R-1-5s-1]|uniref:uracil-DNA glycosylase n=1 Tax=Jeotgalibacillus sp. R-1-5s-1 TaxID=2555897 RepID=UPI00106C2286|nr:uracil-DNA glycosylase [Jeotgalibacillus sp. R-1-5s-1]TFD92885.1 uracil-DNA glycosylase [Jeotgalibacillus sp. R-1-5s-1]
MAVKINNDWQELLQNEFEQPYYKELRAFLKKEYGSETIFPPMNHIFEAFQRTPFHKVKVVILGQDPYHGQGQAHGLSFSVKKGVRIPPSLQNIYKELEEDLGIQPPPHGDLTKWAEEGVLLLNTVLTVREGQAHSHRNQGWERITDKAIELLGERDEPMVFILWGKPAQQKEGLINEMKHCVIKAPHPSPLSAHRGFFGSRPFSKANEFLKENDIETVDWSLS